MKKLIQSRPWNQRRSSYKTVLYTVDNTETQKWANFAKLGGSVSSRYSHPTFPIGLLTRNLKSQILAFVFLCNKGYYKIQISKMYWTRQFNYKHCFFLNWVYRILHWRGGRPAHSCWFAMLLQFTVSAS